MARKLENVFTWSVSRSQQFRSCQRAYYYSYYGAWGGWEADAPERTRLLYILKNMKPMILWAGSTVHDTIKALFESYRTNGQWPELEQVKNYARKILRQGWVESTSQVWLQSPKKTNLFELYYGNGKSLPAEQTAAIKERVFDALENFYHCTTVKRILATPIERWKPVDTLDSFDVDGTKVWCAIDFAYTDEDGALQIIDWKTGNENRQSLRQQLGCYGLYAMDKWGLGVEAIQPSGVFLNDGGRSSSYPIDAELLISVKDQILCSIRAMKSKLRDKDNNAADEDDFELSQDESSCACCTFRKVCPRFKEN